MIYKTTPVESKLVEKGQQHGEARLVASPACPCGCSPLPFILISDGNGMIAACFETAGELGAFQRQVAELKL